MTQTKTFKKLIPYFFLFPAISLLILFQILPIFEAVMQSLHQSELGTKIKTFVGIKNYIKVFSDPVALNSIKITLWFNLLINPIQIALAFALALFLNKKVKGVGLFRSIHFIPIAISMPIAAILWDVMLNNDQGLVNSILIKFGLSAQPFLNSADQALYVIILIATWKGVGYWSIFLLAGLQDVPKSLYEASDIDGANRWSKFWSITFPMMKRPLLFVVVADTVANFLLFAPMYLLTGGGPQDSTNMLMLEGYKSAFVYSDIHRASTIVVVLLIFILGVIAIQSKLLKANH